jgi:hypothetical protein
MSEKDSAHLTQDLKMIFVQKKPSSFTLMANYHGHRNNKLAKDFINKKTGSMLNYSFHSTLRAGLQISNIGITKTKL